MYTFGSLDTYKISHYKKDEKFIIDYKVLLRLYAPIIGSDALSLYLILESEISLNKNCKVHLNVARLHKLLQMDEKQFNNAVASLKEYGLLTYKANQNKANDYLFIIHQTKSAVDFIADKKLNKALQVIVDENYYKQVTSYFISNVIADDEYVDIDDLSSSKKLTEEEFYEQFYEKYPVIANASAINVQTKKEINRLKNLFNLQYNEVENAILNSFDYCNDQMVIDLNKLNNFIEDKYKSKIVVDNSDDLLVKAFEDEKSIAYYKKLCGRNVLLPRETDMINELLYTYQISEGVLNVVINYYFKYGQTTLVAPKKYFEKVIEEMIINNVKSTLDAMNYFRNRKKRTQSYKENLTKKEPKVQNTYKEVENKNVENQGNVDLQTLEKFRKLMGG